MGYIKIEKNGIKYSAEYVVDDNVVTVFGGSGSESTQLGGMSEKGAAHMLLNSLVRKGHIEPTKTVLFNGIILNKALSHLRLGLTFR